MLQKLRDYIRERCLMHAGERIGIAVSGGADSIALLRGMLELRQELGIVLSVVHFNHGIRGAESDADAEFVASIAKEHRLALRQSSGDVPRHAKKWRLSIEATARRLRYEFFRSLLGTGKMDKIATAHTLDDQAETVLLRVLRGAGTRGIAGIHPTLRLERGSIIRPILGISRTEVEAYLASVGQPWREDSTNADTSYTRNRIRHELLPLLERDYNPNIRQVLADAAEVTREEDAHWEVLIEALAKMAIASQDGKVSIRFGTPGAQSVAIQRRLLRRAAEQAGVQLDFQHVEQVLSLLAKPKGTEIELPSQWRAAFLGNGDIRLGREISAEPAGYEYRVTVPGEVRIAPVRILVRLTIVHGNAERQMYNPASLLDGSLLGASLVLRNWRPGDRMRPLHRAFEEKLKRLFQEKKIPAENRPLWPVLSSEDRVVWAKEFGVAADFAATDESDAVKIEVEELPHSS
ncbi:MAG: tRNA lysidine(34) synthetase TilS [Acidobacteriaceae bacterium]